MREIKFRAWVYSMKKMHYWGSDLIGINHNLTWDSLLDGVFNSDDSILMQFTGLLDKNGKEIYEGDIVCCELINVTAAIEFENGGFGIHRMRADMEPLKGLLSSEYEVIGNIYENPELLQ